MSAIVPLVPNKIGELKFPLLSNVETGITAHSGGGQANAYQLGAQISLVTVVAAGNDSVKLPKIVANPGRIDKAGASVGAILFVGNSDGADSMQVYGATPDTINGIATGTGVAVAAGVNVWFAAIDFDTVTGIGRWRMTNSQAAAVAAITSGTISGVTIDNSVIGGITPAAVSGTVFNGPAAAPGKFLKAAATAKTTTTTLLAAEIITGITANPGASTPASYTFPTGTDLQTGLGATFATGEAFFFTATNISTDAAEDVTFLGGVGTTLIGSGAMASNAAATDKSSATFLIRKTGTNTFTVSRV